MRVLGLGSGHYRALHRPEALCFGVGTGRSVIGWSAWRREGAFGLVAAAFGVGLSGLWGDANASTRAPGREPSPGQRPGIKGNPNHVADPRWVGIFVS